MMLKRMIALALTALLLLGVLPAVSAVGTDALQQVSAAEIAAKRDTRAPSDCYVLPDIDLDGMTVVKGTTAYFNYLTYTDEGGYLMRLEVYKNSITESNFITGKNFSIESGLYTRTMTWNTSGSAVGTYYICSMLLDSGENVIDDTVVYFKMTIANSAVPLNSLAFRESETTTAIASKTMFVGDELSLQLLVNPTNFTGKREKTLNSSNKSVAEIDDFAGIMTVYALSAGTANLTVTMGGKTATIKIVVIGDRNCPSAKFQDIPDEKNWAHAGIDFAVSNGLFAGVSNTKFSPSGTMTRAMMVTVLWRLAGKPAATGKNPFRDVPANTYYYEPVIWASNNKIVSGVSADRFNPNGNVTREQIAAIMYRYTEALGYDTSASADISSFPDYSKVSNYAKTALAWANGMNLIAGVSDKGVSYLKPKDNATRAQVATILMRYANSSFQPKPQEADMLRFTQGTWNGTITWCKDDDSLVGQRLTMTLGADGTGSITVKDPVKTVVQYSSTNDKGNYVYTLTLQDKNGNITGGGLLYYDANPNSNGYGQMLLTASDMNISFTRSK